MRPSTCGATHIRRCAFRAESVPAGRGKEAVDLAPGEENQTDQQNEHAGRMAKIGGLHLAPPAADGDADGAGAFRSVHELAEPPTKCSQKHGSGGLISSLSGRTTHLSGLIYSARMPRRSCAAPIVR